MSHTDSSSAHGELAEVRGRIQPVNPDNRNPVKQLTFNQALRPAFPGPCNTGRTEEVVVDLSSQHLVTKTIYNRNCHYQYYELIVTRLSSGLCDYISVIGSSGVGKSVFSRYFFQRFRNENPHHVIVTASFGDSSELRRCLLFIPGQSQAVKLGEIPH
jgi:hypothetical protein